MKQPPSASQSKRITMLAQGRIGKTLFALSAPAIAGMVVMAIYNVVDTIFVSLLRDTTAIAATGIVFPMFQLIGAVGLTFGLGAASVISRKLGEQDHEAAERTAATAFYSSLTVGILLSIAGVIFIQPLLRAFGATDSILSAATLYGRVIIGGSVFQVLNMTANNLLRSEGAALHSSLGQISGAVLNIILDPIFIFVLDMGVTGAAVATVISQAAATTILLSFYFARRGVVHPLDVSHFHPTRATYAAIMTLGLPTFIRQVLGSLSFGVLNNAAARYGDAAIAAAGINMRIFSLIFMTLIGLSHGLQPLVGYNYGARQYPRVRATMRLAFFITLVIGVTAGLIGFLLAPGIMRFFAPQDPAVVEMGTYALRIMLVALIPVGLVIMFGGIFQALGDGRSAIILALGQQGVFLIPLVLILPRIMGLNGVYLAMPSGFILTFIVGLFLMRGVYRKLHAGEHITPDVSPR